MKFTVIEKYLSCKFYNATSVFKVFEWSFLGCDWGFDFEGFKDFTII